MKDSDYFNYMRSLQVAYAPLKSFAQKTAEEMLSTWSDNTVEYPILIVERPDWIGHDLRGGNPMKLYSGALTIAFPTDRLDQSIIDAQLDDIDGHIDQFIAKLIKDTVDNPSHFIRKIGDQVEAMITPPLNGGYAVGKRAQIQFYTFAKLYVNPTLWL